MQAVTAIRSVCDEGEAAKGLTLAWNELSLSRSSAKVTSSALTRRNGVLLVCRFFFPSPVNDAVESFPENIGDSYPDAEGVNIGDSSVATVVVVVSTVSFCFFGRGVTGSTGGSEVAVSDESDEAELSAFRLTLSTFGAATSSSLEEEPESEELEEELEELDEDDESTKVESVS